MSDLNKVMVIGRLTRDSEKNFTPNGTAVCKFNIAVPNGFGDSKKTAFVDITAWGKTAEFVNSYFSKGQEILIEGRLDFDQWEDKDTKAKRSKVYVTAERVSFVGGKENQAEAVKAEVDSDDTIPF